MERNKNECLPCDGREVKVENYMDLFAALNSNEEPMGKAMVTGVRMMTKAEMENTFGREMWRYNAIKIEAGGWVVPFYFEKEFDFLLGADLSPDVGRFLAKNPDKPYFWKTRGMDICITNRVVVRYSIPQKKFASYDGGHPMKSHTHYGVFGITSEATSSPPVQGGWWDKLRDESFSEIHDGLKSNERFERPREVLREVVFEYEFY